MECDKRTWNGFFNFITYNICIDLRNRVAQYLSEIIHFVGYIYISFHFLRYIFENDKPFKPVI